LTKVEEQSNSEYLVKPTKVAPAQPVVQETKSIESNPKASQPEVAKTDNEETPAEKRAEATPAVSKQTGAQVEEEKPAAVKIQEVKSSIVTAKEEYHQERKPESPQDAQPRTPVTPVSEKETKSVPITLIFLMFCFSSPFIGPEN